MNGICCLINKMIKSKKKTRKSYTLKFKAMIIQDIKNIGIKEIFEKH